VRAILLFLLAAVLLLGDTFKLYLKDGDYHLVREYQVQGDRIRYYSTERGDWEEIPTALIDLEKTEREHNARTQAVDKEAKAQDEEDQAERDLRREIASIPVDAGAYYKVGDAIQPLPSADYQIITNKKRKTLQVLSPVPLIPGKASVVIQHDHSSFVVTENRPGFYVRLAQQERFGIVSLTPKKNVRVVENISIVPVAKQMFEDRKQMDTFQQQLGDGLFKIWPEKPLSPGEYALIEFSDSNENGNDEVNLIVWDFACKPGQP
jgi:hypothetical protein